MAKIPKLNFDPAEHADETRLAAWIRYMSYMHKVAPIDVPGRDFTASAQSWVIDRIVFSHVFFDPQTITSTQNSSSVTGAPHILFGWYLKAGSAQVWHAGELLDIREDTFYLFDYSREYFLISPQSEVISVMIPHAQIGYDPLRHAPRLALSRSSPDGAMVVEELERIVRDGDEMARQDVPEEAERFSALFSSLFNRHRTPHAEPQGRKAEIQRYIDERIFAEDVSTESVMAAFEAPRSEIYQSLGMSQNMQNYVERRRLDYALRSLAFGAPDTSRLDDIAAYCRYPSVSAFKNAFEKQYNLPPSCVLGAINLTEELGTAPEASEVWQTWYERAR